MTTRRTFLGAMAAGATALRGLAHAATASKPPLGLQLWSVRELLAKDVPGTLAQVKAWGFDEVETFGPFGAEIAPQLKAAGLKVRAMHIGYDRLQGDMAGVLKDADAVGAKTIVNPYLPHQAKPFATRDEILKSASDFATWSKACRAAGKRFAYHIHGQEFGAAPRERSSTCWRRSPGPTSASKPISTGSPTGAADPVALLNKYPGRVWFTHMKDMAKGVAPGSEAAHREESNVVLGTGRIDIKGILAAGEKAGVEMNFIEDESKDPSGQIPRSVAYYRSL